jgi:hypothetical protein
MTTSLITNITGGAVKPEEWLPVTDNASLPETAEVIDNAALLQVDITAIVGVFIFLTIAQVMPSTSRPAWWGLTSLIVVPFSLSAMAILVEDVMSTEYVMRVIAYNVRFPELLALFGFIIIFIMFFYIYRNLGKGKSTAAASEMQHKPDCQCQNCKDKRKESKRSS